MSHDIFAYVREYIYSGFQNFSGFQAKVLAAIQSGVSINTVGKSKEHALTYLCGYGDSKAIRFFVENGANVNYVDAWGYTPLNNAITTNKVEDVKYLVQNGANTNYIDGRNNKPIDYAISYNLEIAKYLHGLGSTSSKNDLTFLNTIVL
jgi:ankyrin repeat protein